MENDLLNGNGVLISALKDAPDAVRDMAWLLDTQWNVSSVMKNTHGEAYANYEPPNTEMLLPWLHSLALDAGPLETSIKKAGNKRLGLYFETLIAFYFENCPCTEWHIEKRNTQIIEGPRTVGELDFLLQTPMGLRHLEVAVKFYLGLEQNGEILWIGPNGQDRLDLKLERMANHQLPLGRRFAKESQFWLKGMLFQPWKEKLPLPEDIRQSVAEFHWIYGSEFLTTSDLMDFQWHKLSKLRWLTGYSAEEPRIADITATVKKINEEHRPQMLCNTKNSMRLMVVYETWPAVEHELK